LCAGQIGMEPSRTRFSTVTVVVKHVRFASGETVPLMLKTGSS
jgi:hypothetical protein